MSPGSLTKINIIGNNIGLAKYASNALWLLMEQSLRIFSGLFIGIWIARHLGVESFGVYSYILTISAILAGISRLGVDAILLRELASKPMMRDVYLGTVFWIRILSAVSILTISIMLLLFSSGLKEVVFIFIISVSLLFQSFDVIEQCFLSRVLGKQVSISKIIQLLISSALKVYGIIAGAELFYFVIIFGLDSLVYAALLIIYYKKTNGLSFLKKYNPTEAKKILFDSSPLFFSVIVVLIYQRFDYIFVREMMGDYSVGLYAAGLKFTDSFYFVPTILVSLFSVALINAKDKPNNLYDRRMAALFWLIIVVTGCIAGFVYFMGDILINSFYGEAYSESAKILKLHSVTIIFVGIGIFTTKWHIIENRTQIVFYNTAIGALVSVFGNLWSIPIFGVQGAVMTSVVAHLMADIVMNFFWKETRIKFCKIIYPGLNLR
jgi:O-antigen/teichoic acid export membrane protein